jgi:hypothetical protein
MAMNLPLTTSSRSAFGNNHALTWDESPTHETVGSDR